MSKRIYVSGYQKRCKAEEKKRRACENTNQLESYFGCSLSSVTSTSAVCSSHAQDNVAITSFAKTYGDSKEDDKTSVVMSPSVSLADVTMIMSEVDDSDAAAADQNETPESDIVDSAAPLNPHRNTIVFAMDNPYPSDRGLYPANIVDDNVRYMIVKHGPCQPKGPFPVRPGNFPFLVTKAKIKLE